MIIIAEVGINHNGGIDLAHEMIKQAKLNGADIVKFQFYDPAKIFGPKGSYPDKDNYEFALKVQFGFDQAKQLKQWCDRERIEFMASVFDLERFKWVESLGVKRHKIASRVVEDKELCEAILATGKETFISLGFWEGEGVPYNTSNARYLYCVPKYPCPHSDIHMPRDFSDSIYQGVSDHTIGIETVLVAVSRGAKIVEKHFTLDKDSSGPDHICSMTPEELKILSLEATRIERFLKIENESGLKVEEA